MKDPCEICSRPIEPHLLKQKKKICFSCLTEQVEEKGSIPAFNLKEKPVLAPCAVCEKETSGGDLVPSPWGFMCGDCRTICETQSGVSWDLLRVSAQKEWLVKANSKVLGPYTADEVDGLIRESRFVPHDEIMKPLGRWHLLRDEDQFRLVLNEIKNRNLNRRSSEITSSGSGTGSGTTTPRFEEVVKEKSLHVDSILESSGGGSHSSGNPNSTATTRDLLKTYTTGEAFKASPKLVRMRARRFWMGVVLFLIAGLFVSLKFTKPRKGDESRDSRFQELMATGLNAEKVGQYQRAFEEYSEARLLRPDDPELLLHLAPLTLVYDRQALQAQRMFRLLLENVKEPNYQKSSYLGLGLIAFQHQEYDVAKENFNKALGLDGESMPAIANLGMVSYIKGDYRDAEGLLLRANEIGIPDGAVVIALADVYMAQGEGPGGRTKIFNAHNLLDRFLQLSFDYRQEVLVEDARALILSNRPGEASKKIEELLDVDPEGTDLHIHDWSVIRDRASWGLLLETLKKVAGEVAGGPRMTAALGLAMYRGREKLEGAQSIEQALSQAPSDPLLMALAGWIELKLGRKESGVVNVKQAALEAEKYKLPHILLARLCQQERDYECSRRQWELVLKMDSRSVEALHGLALASWYHKDKDQTQSYLKQLFANDPNYIPYLQLVQDLRAGTLTDSQ